jgi:hypothetical protein
MNHTFNYWDSHRLGVAPGVEYTKEEADAAQRATRPLKYLQQLLLRLCAADRSDGLSSKEKEEKNKRMRQRQGRPQSRKTGGANLDKIRPKNNSRERRQSRGPPSHTHCHLSKSTMSDNNRKAKPSYSLLKTATNSMPTKPKSRSPGNSSTVPRRRVPPKPMHLPRAHKSDPCFLQRPQTQHKHKSTSPTTTNKPPRRRRSSENDISSTQQDVLRSYRRSSSVDDIHINSKRIDRGHSSSFQTY